MGNGESRMGNRERSLDLKSIPSPYSLFPIPYSRFPMGNAGIKQGLMLATLAALASGCSTWEGPRAKVEDRTVASKAGAKDSGKAAPQKAPNREATQKPQREERRAAKEQPSPSAKDTTPSPGAHAIADAVSSDQVVDMKPDKSLRSLR
jgi:hypothetical protein